MFISYQQYNKYSERLQYNILTSKYFKGSFGAHDMIEI